MHLEQIPNGVYTVMQFKNIADKHMTTVDHFCSVRASLCMYVCHAMGASMVSLFNMRASLIEIGGVRHCGCGGRSACEKKDPSCSYARDPFQHATGFPWASQANNEGFPHSIRGSPGLPSVV